MASAGPSDAVPTLKAGSTIGIPSPPAIWNPGADADRLIVTPQIGDAEEMQGFPRGWTEPAGSVSTRKGTRWKLVGNAVTVGVSRWVGERLMTPGEPLVEGVAMTSGSKWPTAAYGSKGDAWAVDVSLWPKQMPYRHLADLVDLDDAPPLSARATAGFLNRAERSTLNFADGFLADMAAARRSSCRGSVPSPDEPRRPEPSSDAVRDRMRRQGRRDTEARDAACGGPCSPGASDTDSTEHRSEGCAGAPTSCSARPRSPCTSTGASGTRAPSTPPCRRTTVSGGSRSSQANVARDRDTDRQLREAGWQVIRVWEHEDMEAAADRVMQAVRPGSSYGDDDD